MKELSLNILDITENSTKAGAKNIIISIVEQGGCMTVTIKDDGCGMTKEILQSVVDPFYTTRTTRKVGMGIPLFKLAAEQTGGSLKIESVCEQDDPVQHGTTVTAVFHTDHIDCPPMGDIVSTLTTLIGGNPDVHFLFSHQMDGKTVGLDTDELKSVLGDVPLNTFEVLKWIEAYLKEQYDAPSSI